MRLALEVVGVPEACAGIENGVMRMQIAAAKQMGVEMIGLRDYVVTEHLHGPTGATTLQQRSGNLARNIASEVLDEGVSITGLVGVPVANTAPYARILHEGGTTRAHVIEASEGKTLAFESNNRSYSPWGLGATGGLVFRRLVHHPGSNFPARPYLTSALEEQAAQIRANLTEAIVGASHE